MGWLVMSGVWSAARQSSLLQSSLLQDRPRSHRSSLATPVNTAVAEAVTRTGTVSIHYSH